MNMNSQFDGSAAFAGGRFMPSQFTQFADPSSPSNNRNLLPMLPQTVKQIREAFQSGDDKTNFLIDGVDVNNVTLVGLVFNKMERVTDIAFVIDDGTGRIDCIKWKSEAVDNNDMERILNGMHVRVHGHLKGFQGEKQLVVLSIRPVHDYNEIAYHFLECMYAQNYNIKLRSRGPTSSVPNTPYDTLTKGYQTAPSNQYPGPVHSGLDQMVAAFLKQPEYLAREAGAHVNEIAVQLTTSVKKVRYRSRLSQHL